MSDELKEDIEFIRDLASEELEFAKVGTGAEVALRHIVRKANEILDKNWGNRNAEGRASC